MNLTQQTLKRNPAQIGAFISPAECATLIADFKQKFSDEVYSLNIRKRAIEQLLTDENVSGIRFMYGLTKVNDVQARIIILMPCNYTMQGNIPNVVFSKSGFLTHTGSTISLDEACQIQLNHVVKFKNNNPDVAYTKILRGYFLGRDVLSQFISRTNEKFITYNFGYDVARQLAFKPVLLTGENSFGVDMGELCPDNCTPPGGGNGESCIATYIANMFADNKENELNLLRSFRDELLNKNLDSVQVEKYYTISASIMEKLSNDVNRADVAQILYSTYFKNAVESLVAQDKINTFKLFEDCMEYMINKYLYQ